MPEAQRPEPPAGRVLVVDDVDASCYVTARVLQGAGYEVEVARCGAECLQRAAAAPPDAIVLDVRLPDISGFEVARRLRDDPRTAAAALLHLSASFVSPASRAFGLMQAADSYLVQPVEPQVLLATVAALLRMRRAERALSATLDGERRARAAAQASEAQVRALNEALRAALRGRDDFLSMVSHEIKTPVTAVQIMLETLRRRLRRGADVVPTLGGRLDDIAAQSNRLVAMLDILLDLSRLGSDTLAPTRRPFDLASLCAEVAGRPHLEDGAAAPICVALPGRPVIGAWDPLRLDQVLSNLVGNARKYGGPHIELGLRDGGDAVHLWVEDNGHGIAAADAPRAFERFARLPAAHGKSGFGIGLWLVARIVAAQGGEVRLDNPGGPGCRFAVRLPRAAPL